MLEANHISQQGECFLKTLGHITIRWPVRPPMTSHPGRINWVSKLRLWLTRCRRLQTSSFCGMASFTVASVDTAVDSGRGLDDVWFSYCPRTTAAVLDVHEQNVRRAAHNGESGELGSQRVREGKGDGASRIGQATCAKTRPADSCHRSTKRYKSWSTEHGKRQTNSDRRD